jgi:hypothetical protein
MKKGPQEQPSDSSIDSLEESRARLESMQQLVCHLLSRNQQLRVELSDSSKASSSDGHHKNLAIACTGRCFILDRHDLVLLAFIKSDCEPI